MEKASQRGLLFWPGSRSRHSLWVWPDSILAWGAALVSQLWVQVQLNPQAGFPLPCYAPVTALRGMHVSVFKS